jgi:hypothetical protein
LSSRDLDIVESHKFLGRPAKSAAGSFSPAWLSY